MGYGEYRMSKGLPIPGFVKGIGKIDFDRRNTDLSEGFRLFGSRLVMDPDLNDQRKVTVAVRISDRACEWALNSLRQQTRLENSGEPPAGIGRKKSV